MATDPMTTVKTILTNNWTAANTDSITPTFIFITDKKRLDFGSNRAFILIHVPRNNTKPAGVGPSGKHEVNKYELDIRVMGADYRSTFLKIIEETKRILQANKVNPYSSASKPLVTCSVLDYDEDGQDLSNGTHDYWRYLLPVQLSFFNVTR